MRTLDFDVVLQLDDDGLPQHRLEERQENLRTAAAPCYRALFGLVRGRRAAALEQAEGQRGRAAWRRIIPRAPRRARWWEKRAKYKKNT